MSMKNKNTRFAPKFHVKKGDKVEVIAGKDKGKQGVILEMQPSKNKAVVEGLNVVTKHVKPTETEQGGINKIPAPIHLSNIMLVGSDGEPTRVGRKLVDGKLVRYSKKTGEIIK